MRVASSCITSQFESFVLGEQPRNFRIDSLFSSLVKFIISPLDQFFYLMLNNFLFCFRLFAFTYLIFIVHKMILLHSEYCFE